MPAPGRAASSWGGHRLPSLYREAIGRLRGIAPGQSEVVSVAVSRETEKWEVNAPLMHFSRRHGPLELRRWMLERDQTNALAQIAYKLGGAVVSRLPVPAKRTAFYTSGWLTNRPPEWETESTD